MSLTRVYNEMTNDSISKYSNDLATAVSEIGSSTPTRLVIDNPPEALTSNLTIPSNIHLRWYAGCEISGAYTLTISGTLEAGAYKLFDSTTAVSFANGSADNYIWQWFGNGTVFGTKLDISTELQSLADALPIITTLTDDEEGAGTVFVSAGRYIVNGVDFPSGIVLRGASGWSTMFFWTEEDYSIRIKRSGVAVQPKSAIEHINFRGGGDGVSSTRYGNIFSGNYNGDGLTTTQVHILNCWFAPSYMGIYFNGSTDNFVHDNVFDSGVSSITLANSTENKIYRNEFFSQTRSAILITETNKDSFRRNYITDNTFQSMESGAILATDTSSTGGKGRLVVRNNDFNMSTTASIYTTNAMLGIEYMQEVVSQNNSFVNGNSTKTINGILINHPGVLVRSIDDRVEGAQYGITINNGLDYAYNDYKIINASIREVNRTSIRILSGCDGTLIDNANIHNANLSSQITSADGSGVYIDSNYVGVVNSTIGDQSISAIKMLKCVVFNSGLFGGKLEKNSYFGWETGSNPVDDGGSEVAEIQMVYQNATASGEKVTYNIGDMIIHNDGTTGNPSGWVVTGAGTQSSIGTLTGSISSGDNILTLSSTAPDSLQLGSYITIAGVTGPQRVKWISGTSVYVTPAADATVTGVNVTDSTPTVSTMANFV